jgi:hypothetical protein
MEQRWNDVDREKLFHCHLSTTNPTWNVLGENLSFHGEKTASNRLSCAAADWVAWYRHIIGDDWDQALKKIKISKSEIL